MAKKTTPSRTVKAVPAKPAKGKAPPAPVATKPDLGGCRSLFANLPLGALFVWPGRDDICVRFSAHFYRVLNTSETRYLTQTERETQVWHLNERFAAEALIDVSHEGPP